MKKSFGVVMAALILAAWTALLIRLLSLKGNAVAMYAVPAIFMQTLLYTGLFITAHDAVHGSVMPRRHRFNSVVGAVCLALYALFPFRRIREKHFDHHRYPASPKDPDYHDGLHTSFFGWYLNFLKQYITWKQLVGMSLIFNLLHHLLKVPAPNLLLFWVTPALLSTMQLFYFGTYLPHREPPTGYADRHRAVSSTLKPFYSLLACYHFDYHWEHHEFPAVPWWSLSIKRREILSSSNSF